MYKVLLLSLAASVAIAADLSPPAFRRQVTTSILPCSYQGQKDCGTGCIDLTWTCCPDQAGGCPPTDYCSLGTNNQYDCCPIGEICSGPGGVSTIGGTTISETISETSTSVSTSTATLAPNPTPTSIETSVSTPSPTSSETSSYTVSSVYTSSTPSGIVVPSTTSSSNSSFTTTALATFTGGANENYGDTSLAHALGPVLAALFIFV